MSDLDRDVSRGGTLFLLLTGLPLTEFAMNNTTETRRRNNDCFIIRQIEFFCCCFMLINLLALAGSDRGAVPEKRAKSE